MGRKPLGESAMSGAERIRRWRERHGQPAPKAADETARLRAEVAALRAQLAAKASGRASEADVLSIMVDAIDDNTILTAIKQWREGKPTVEKVRKAIDISQLLAGGGLPCFTNMRNQHLADKEAAGDVIDLATLKPVTPKMSKREEAIQRNARTGVEQLLEKHRLPADVRSILIAALMKHADDFKQNDFIERGILRSTYRKVLAELHPDRTPSSSTEAFTAFRTLEKKIVTDTTLPWTLEELKEGFEKARQANSARSKAAAAKRRGAKP